MVFLHLRLNAIVCLCFCAEADATHYLHGHCRAKVAKRASSLERQGNYVRSLGLAEPTATVKASGVCAWASVAVSARGQLGGFGPGE